MHHNRTSKYLKQKLTDNGEIDKYTTIGDFNMSLSGIERTI